jgi:hypothetical protein
MGRDWGGAGWAGGGQLNGPYGVQAADGTEGVTKQELQLMWQCCGMLCSCPARDCDLMEGVACVGRMA